MRERTAPSDMFMGPWGLSWLRGETERPCFVTFKDGGQVLYDRDYAEEWRRCMAIVQTLSRCRHAGLFRQIARDCGVRYIIGNPQARLGLPVAFENEAYVVYDVGTGSRH